MSIIQKVLPLLGAAGLVACSAHAATEPAARPNVLLILADDMGYSDLGCYGSEIATPNLDRLAAGGLRFSRFYNGARCCPSRASLLTGLYAHQAGMGGMVSQQRSGTEPDPFQGYLNDHCVTLAEVLKQAGYRTMISGKWHVGEFRDQWPLQRGFDRYYGLVSGAMNYFNIEKGKRNTTRIFLDGNREIRPAGDGFYATRAFTDAALAFLDEAGGGESPFFLYLAYTAPHYPLHALPEDIEKYRGKYLQGWEQIRKDRYRQMKENGILTEAHLLSPPHPDVIPWEEVDDHDEMDLKMAIYAAQMESMDRGIGQVVDKITSMGQLDNTLILFLSDNGACAENTPLGGVWRERTGELGTEDSYEAYGLCWANAGNTPFRKFKAFTTEGGILTPFIVHWPAGTALRAEVIRHPAHIIDIMPTLCEVAGAEYPSEFNGREILPPEGRSILPALRGQRLPPHDLLCWEHLGEKAALAEPWKIVKGRHNDNWELYDLSKDPVELHDLADELPDKRDDLVRRYQAWQERVVGRAD